MKRDNTHKPKTGFKTPESYFDDFENKLLNNITASQKEKSILDSQLSSGFKTPNGYFTSLEDDLLNKINPSQQSKGKVISIFTKRNLLFASGIAAMITIIFSLSINTRKELDFEDINITDVQTYFEEGNFELNSTEIASLFDDDTYYLETFDEELIDNETIYDYLSEEDLTDEIIFVK
ncbi:hypothetical protein ABW636_02165 [Aquimarina sp. 2201CG1-2-11]|uniref:hypothetical protein n=1 Tax=Aquimarina discodermiae TaxID=3231043 RepID=UPI003462CF59